MSVYKRAKKEYNSHDFFIRNHEKILMTTHDRTLVRRLAAEIAEIAALPIQEQKRAMWRRLNDKHPDRPMVMIDQVCWNEMNVDDELTLRCEDAACRQYEAHLRQILYQWRHFRVDMVVDPFIRVSKAVSHSGLGVATIDAEVAITDPTNSVVGHRFTNQFETDADLDKIRNPVVSHDAQETARRLESAHALFDGVLDVVELCSLTK